MVQAIALSLILILFIPSKVLAQAEVQYPLGKVETRLYLGLTDSTGRAIPIKAWRAFVDTCIAKQFPDGFTVIDARGMYRARSGRVISEPTKLLVILHDSSAEAIAGIRRITTSYLKAYKQETVLRQDLQTGATIIELKPEDH